MKPTACSKSVQQKGAKLVIHNTAGIEYMGSGQQRAEAVFTQQIALHCPAALKFTVRCGACAKFLANIQ